MRPQGFAHAGFYPLTEGAAKIAAEQLVVTENMAGMISVIDPCIGDGIAIKRIMDALRIPYENLTGVELTRNRSEEAQANLPGAKIVGPACFLSGVNRPDRAFTFVYCNPPYADESGGGYRVETQFLDKLAHMVPIGAVIMMVVPQATGNLRAFTNTVAKNMGRVRTVELPTEFAPFKETLVIGYRRNAKPTSEWSDHYVPDNENYGDSPEGNNRQLFGTPFVIPPAKRIVDSLHKIMLTDEEIIEHLLESPIEREVSTPPPIGRGRPPLALGTGHNGILVASGQAPPVVTLRDSKGRMLEVPHLIRGVARKEQYIKSVTEEEGDKGQVKTKTVISESVDLKMMAMLHTGQIIDLNEQRDSRAIDDKQQKKVAILHTDQGSGDGGIGI